MPDTRRDVPRTTPTANTTPPPSKASATNKPAKEAAASKKASANKKASAPASDAQISKPSGSNQKTISADERRRMIAEAAYMRAQQRGFMEGDEMRDWLEAEREVDSRLNA